MHKRGGSVNFLSLTESKGKENRGRAALREAGSCPRRWQGIARKKKSRTQKDIVCNRRGGDRESGGTRYAALSKN